MKLKELERFVTLSIPVDGHHKEWTLLHAKISKWLKPIYKTPKK